MHLLSPKRYRFLILKYESRSSSKESGGSKKKVELKRKSRGKKSRQKKRKVALRTNSQARTPSETDISTRSPKPLINQKVSEDEGGYGLSPCFTARARRRWRKAALTQECARTVHVLCTHVLRTQVLRAHVLRIY